MSLVEEYGNEEGSERNYFVKRVFALLSVQLAFTAACVLVAMFTDPIKHFFLRTPWIIPVAMLVFLATSISIQCCPLGRAPPWNYLLLIIATCAKTVAATGIAVRYRTLAVFIAFLITCLLCVFLTFLACSSFDFTRLLLYVMVFGLVMILVGAGMSLCFLFFKYIKILHMVYAGAATLLFSMMFVVQLQMILGGRTAELDTSEYVSGALMLYTCILQIFLNILTLTNLFES